MLDFVLIEIMGLLDTVRDKIAENIVSAIFSAIFFFIAILTGAIVSMPLLKDIDTAFERILIALFCISFIFNVITMSAFLTLRRRMKGDPIRHFGALWDAMLNPLCPACAKLIQGPYINKEGQQYFQCPSCKNTLALISEEGKRLELKEARQLIQNTTGLIEKREMQT